MPHPADTHQAHATSAYLYPNSNRQNATQPQPRSSSLPFLMGSSQSKTPPTPSPINVVAGSSSKAFTAAVAGGIKLKRAFAARRKKSEDVSSQLSPAHSSVQASDTSGSGKSTVRQPPSSLVPTMKSPPDSVTVQANKLPAPSSPNQSSLSPQTSWADTDMNRNSVIPLSPGISSAVNYMTLYDHPSPSSPVSSTPPAPSPQSSPEKEKDRDTDREKEREIDSEKEKENQRQTKESWRKSDSTNSHHTIRPAARNSRPVSWAESFQSAYTVVPPPSTTSNQGGSGSSPRSRPRSALLGDSDFSMIELEEEELEMDTDQRDGDAGDTVPLDLFVGNKPFTAVPPKEETSAPLASVSTTDHDADIAALGLPSTSAQPTHASLPPVGKGSLDHLSSPFSTTQRSMPSTPSSPKFKSNGGAYVQGKSMSSSCGINGIDQSQRQTSNSSMKTGAPKTASGSTAGPSSSSSSSSVNASSSFNATASSAVCLHNERVLPSLPSSSSSVSSPSSSGSVPSSGSSSYPHSHLFSHSYSFSPPPSSGPGSSQQQPHPQPQQRSTSGHNNSHNNMRTPLQPVRQQLSMPNSSSSSGNGRPAGQDRQYDYQYPLQLSSPPQSPHSHTSHSQRQPQQQPRAQTVSLSSPSPSSSPGSGIGMSMGSTMHSAAAGLAKRAVEKGRRWAMGLGGGHGGESDRERGGTGNGSTSSTSACAGGGTSGYSSSSSGSMFEGGQGVSPGGSVRRPHSHSISHPITHPTPSGGGGGSTSTTTKFLQNTSSKIIHVHASKSRGGRHTGGAQGSMSSVSSDSHSSDGHYHGQGPSPSLPSPSPGITSGPSEDAGPHLGVKLRAGVLNMGGMGPRGGGVVFKRALSACVRDTSIWAGSMKDNGGSKVGEEVGEGASKESGAKGQQGGTGKGRRGKGDLVSELENRKLPALVVRCAQHLLLWGIHEEGLFRVSGMPQHVARLRAEFDSGADYDMTKCTLGDLDPHAVASVFKAYLRELPEPILTQKLLPYFDAAVNKETSTNAAAAAGGVVESSTPTRMQGLAATPSGGAHHHPGLPSGPKSGFNFIGPPPASSSSSSSSAKGAAAAALALRKAPSLSTLAMPSFNGIPPPSQTLITTFRMLIDQLPQENKDLVRTVVDLIKATARESKETKMPLSNLMLVFCPSLNMTPPLLKVLCEAEGIWGEDKEVEGEEDEEEEEDLHDIRRRTVMPSIPVSAPGDIDPAEDVPPPLPAKDGVRNNDDTDDDAKSTADTEEEGSILSGRASLDTDITDNNLSSDYHASAEEEDEEDGSSIFDGQEGSEVTTDASVIRGQRRRPQLKHEVIPSSARDSEVPTVYLDSRSHCSTASSMSSLVISEELQDDENVDDETEDLPNRGGQREGEGEMTPGVKTCFNQQALKDSARDDALSVSSGGYSINNMPISPPPPLSSSPESIATPTSSGNPSLTHLPSTMGNENGIEMEKDEEHSSALDPQIVEMNQLQLKPEESQRDLVGAPIVAPTSIIPNKGTVKMPQPIQFPSSSPSTSPYHYFPYPEPTVSSNTPIKTKRRSIPILSLPNFSPSLALLPGLSHTPPSSSPNGSPQSVAFPIGDQEKEKTLKANKPSLKLLFSKRSASSLTSMTESKGMAFISNPIPQNPGPQVSGQTQGQHPVTPLSAASALHNCRNSPKSASESSISTPLSAVTAPQSSLRSVSASGTLNLPPVLDTPIEGGSLGLDYGPNPSPPATAMLTAQTKIESEKEEGTRAKKESGPGPNDLPQLVQKRVVVGRSSQQKYTANQEQSTKPFSYEKATAVQLRSQPSTSNLSIVSTTSSHHLSLFEDDDKEDVEDWTQSVLLAADSNWAIHNGSDKL